MRLTWVTSPTDVVGSIQERALLDRVFNATDVVRSVKVQGDKATLAHAGTAFLSGEQESGLHKICYYDYLGDTVAITIRSTQLCPLTIRTN